MKNVRDTDELWQQAMSPEVPGNRTELGKQLSTCVTSQQAAWDKQQDQIHAQERSYGQLSASDERHGFWSPKFGSRSLTDREVDDLRGLIDLGFDFNEEEHHHLCNKLPALDLYFAIKRQHSIQVSSPDSSSAGQSSALGSSNRLQSEWRKFCNLRDNPEQVERRLRHWAQIVAALVNQSFRNADNSIHGGCNHTNTNAEGSIASIVRRE